MQLEQDLRSCHARVAGLQKELAADKEAPATPMPVAEVPAAPLIAPVQAVRSGGIPAQDLTAIRGIGPAFERRLNEAGVGTYSQVAGLSDAELRAIIKPEKWQKFNFESWN